MASRLMNYLFLLSRFTYTLATQFFIPIMSFIIRRFSRQIDYVSETRAPVNTDGARPNNDTLEKHLTAINDLVARPPITLSVANTRALLDALIHTVDDVGIDDRRLLLEKVVFVMSRLEHTVASKKLQQAALTILYKDLPHPPSGYLCLPPSTLNVISKAQSHANYAFRFANGSYNNVLNPTLGQAGSPYARSVPTSRLSPRFALPDPGLLFDTLLKRDKFVPHPGGISALFFAFADLVIHSIFNTNHTDWTINDASSYLDLSILYGNNDAQVDSVRRKDGSGKLWDDVFADGRLLFMPPASCALLILMNRNHNYIAQRILDINENRNLKPLPLTDETLKQKQDDEIFHRARLVNCGYFIHIILGDYVGAILGLVRDESDWRLDPLMTIRDSDHAFVPVGEGNVVSIEFNLLYRWHATLSAPDTAWTTETFEGIFEGSNPAEVTVQQFAAAAHSHMIPPRDVREWTFDKLERDADGRFKDSDLAKILHNSTEARAGAYKARGIPEALRVIEIMGIQQSRSWGTCSLNEFRKFLGLKQYSTFAEWNPDPEIHTAAAALYKDIDNLELYVGLQAEETKEPGPGAGLCPGYTISRAILADAVCLTRGDRFLTVDFTPFNLTAWGYQDCQYDPQDGSYGGLLTKLLFRTLPDYYPAGSAYAHFPFLDPVYMKDHLEKMNPKLAEKYSWERPQPRRPAVPIDTFADAIQVLKAPHFVSAYDSRLFKALEPVLMKKMQYRPDGNMLEEAKNKLLSGAATVSEFIFSDLDPSLATYFAKKTEELIKSKSFDHVGKGVRYVDIVRDVINLVPVHWISQEIAGLPLKTEDNPRGAWYEQDTYEMFADIARYVYLGTNPVHDWRLREAAQKHSAKIVDYINVDGNGKFATFNGARNYSGIASYELFQNLWQTLSGRPSRPEYASDIFVAVVPSAALYSQAVCVVVHYYLREDRKAELEEIIKLVESSDQAASTKVMAYVYEALRVDPPAAGVYRTATKDVRVGPITIQANTPVFVNIAKANLDSSAVGPDAASAAAKSVMWFPEHGLLTTKFFEATVPAVLASIFKMKNIGLGPGQSGSLNHFSEDWNGAQTTQYVTTQGVVSPWPDSLIVQYSK